jgi:fructose-1,6-bisphosphatase/inositol monophosphatase family enzyme
MIDSLIACEAAFVTAGQRARELQAGIKPELKSDTGDYNSDVVTRADREVQRLVLESLVCTEATRCCLVAEESEAPELMSRFSPDGKLYLSLDPIDGTRRYTEGKQHYCLIVGLHDGQRPLYTFVYYPALDWWLRLSERGAESSGPAPHPEGVGDLSQVIVYTAGHPEQQIPGYVEQLGKAGYSLVKGDSIVSCGSKFLVLSGLAGGYYAGNPNAYDGLFALHYGQATGRQVVSTLDLTRREESPRGLRYGGFYLVLPPGLEA